jgi:hypothetical protein
MDHEEDNRNDVKFFGGGFILGIIQNLARSFGLLRPEDGKMSQRKEEHLKRLILRVHKFLISLGIKSDKNREINSHIFYRSRRTFFKYRRLFSSTRSRGRKDVPEERRAPEETNPSCLEIREFSLHEAILHICWQPSGLFFIVTTLFAK